MATGSLRALAVLLAFFGLTLPLMLVQAVLLRISDKAARRFPHWYHRQVCRILGIRLKVEGAVVPDAPALLVCNHTSWLDIPVLSALAPVSFVAKFEVGGWPFVSALARLQRSIFIDRTRRQAAGEAASEIMARLKRGDTVVLFAEGTSSDGNRVLPFKTSLFGAVIGQDTPPAGSGNRADRGGRLHERPRHPCHTGRPAPDRLVRRYGDDVARLGGPQIGTITVTINVSEPVPLSEFRDRKDLALKSERTIRRAVLGILRGRPGDPDLVPVEPSEDHRRGKSASLHGKSQKWT